MRSVVGASSKKICQKVEDMILQDHCTKVSIIAHELGISAGTVSSIIHSMMSSVSSRWVPQILTHEQKACWQQFSKENLDMLRANPENFVSRIITWVIQRWNKSTCNGNTRGPILPRIYVCNNQPERWWQQFFWDSESVKRLEFMPHKTTITRDTYASTMVALHKNIEQKRGGKLSAGVLLLHDNASHACHALRGLLQGIMAS